MDEIEVSPEEQQAFDQAVTIVEDILYGEGPIGDQVAKIVSQDQDILLGIGKATAAVLMAVEQKMQVAEDMKMELAQEIVEELVDIAVKTGALAEDELDDRALEEIVKAGVAEYLRLADATGSLDPAKLQQDVAATQQEMSGSSAGLFEE
jgi:hypothetical protein